MPDMLNWFGWCTWDAFYTEVTSEVSNKASRGRYYYFFQFPFNFFYQMIMKYSFEKGGISPKFVIIDDGWQSVGMDVSSVEVTADNTAK